MATKIGLIDFDESLMEANRSCLESLGYEVHTASDGITGLRMLEEVHPQIAVLELVLGKMHGLQVCDAIRKSPDLRNLKVMVAASPTFAIDVRKAREMGAAYFLNKPYTPGDLGRAITALERVPVPDNEGKRLAALKSYDILDTSPEKSFDDLTQLTAIICGTPAATISFVDADRLWYKAKVGFIANEVPRELSFCAHAIMEQDVMVVEDATKDDRFAGNPLVTSGPNRIRFYAGSPLRNAEGDALGTICVIDNQPRVVTSQQKQALRLIANQIQVLLEFRKRLNDGKAEGARTA